MKQVFFSALLGASTLAQPTVPPNLVAEGIPPISAEIRESAARYLDFRTAAFQSWHPRERSMVITTRFADSAQLHQLTMPMGARQQLTFFTEPVASAAFNPVAGNQILFSRDTGGGEFYQLYLFNLDTGDFQMLTDGNSRNTGPRWSNDGKWIAFSSTRRTGRDTDIWVMNPLDSSNARMALQLQGGGWSVADWSTDDQQLSIIEYISINESHIWVADLDSGEKRRITPAPAGGGRVAFSGAQFSKDGKALFTTSDAGSEFRRLGRIELDSGRFVSLTKEIQWDVSSFDLSPDGTKLAFVTNEGGISVLRLIDAETGEELFKPVLPGGVIDGLEWHQNSRDIGFTFASARAASDAFSFNTESQKIERWTRSEMGGLNPARFVEPSLVQIKSFDQLEIPLFVYRPDPSKFPGKRPSLVLIHGGPESQSRPGFLGRYNYFINELGIALVVPNVRGSAGYGKTFLALDNGFKREDSVKDIGAVLDWIDDDPQLDPEKVAVIGGSYGGYMVLASMIHFAERIRAGIDVVGISNFLTFLKNTQDYRRDLRRVEYGDERDPAMHEFLAKISPSTRAREIKDPLFVIQGKNDPRVPVTESEQMVAAVRDSGGTVWYLMAEDEGHGFRKKSNQDYQFLCTILFLEKHLLAPNDAEPSK